MTGEDKMNRIFVYIGIIAGLLLGGSLSVEAQKKPLDIEACTSWKRIDAPDISPTGRWVTYRISLMEYNPASKEEKTAFIRFPYAEGNIAEWRYRASGVL